MQRIHMQNAPKVQIIQKMKRYAFTISGNHEHHDGNPIPYTRTTQNSQWTDKAIRYRDWKEYVQKAFFEYLKSAVPSREYNLMELASLKKGKPIEVKEDENIAVFIEVYWKNNAHSDLDNVFKGIADAMFVNDKPINHIIAHSAMSPSKTGWVGVVIEITKKK